MSNERIHSSFYAMDYPFFKNFFGWLSVNVNTVQIIGSNFKPIAELLMCVLCVIPNSKTACIIA